MGHIKRGAAGLFIVFLLTKLGACDITLPGKLIPLEYDYRGDPGTEPPGPAVLVTFVDPGQTLGIANSRALALGDIDGDGDSDMIVGNDGSANQIYFQESAP